MRIAAVQHDIVWEDRDANFERLAPQVARAVGAGAELVLLTETFSTGFSMTPGIGEPEGGPSSQFLAARAAEHGVWLAGTCPETGADGDGWAFCRSLPERAGVVAVPTVVFYDPAHADLGRHLVRFAFCKREEVIGEAVARLRRMR